MGICPRVELAKLLPDRGYLPCPGVSVSNHSFAKRDNSGLRSGHSAAGEVRTGDASTLRAPRRTDHPAVRAIPRLTIVAREG